MATPISAVSGIIAHLNELKVACGVGSRIWPDLYGRGMRVEECSDGMVEVYGSAQEFEDLASVVTRGEGRFPTEDLAAV